MSVSLWRRVCLTRISGDSEKCLMLYVAMVAQDDGSSIFCSKATIAEHIGFSRHRVGRTIKSLIDHGYLDLVKVRRNNVQEYQINVERLSPLVRSVEVVGTQRSNQDDEVGIHRSNLVGIHRSNQGTDSSVEVGTQRTNHDTEVGTVCTNQDGEVGTVRSSGWNTGDHNKQLQTDSSESSLRSDSGDPSDRDLFGETLDGDRKQVTDPMAKILWSGGLDLLESMGISQTAGRQLIGQQLKIFTPDKVFQAIQATHKAQPQNPLRYVRGVLKNGTGGVSQSSPDTAGPVGFADVTFLNRGEVPPFRKKEQEALGLNDEQMIANLRERYRSDAPRTSGQVRR